MKGMEPGREFFVHWDGYESLVQYTVFPEFRTKQAFKLYLCQFDYKEFLKMYFTRHFVNMYIYSKIDFYREDNTWKPESGVGHLDIIQEFIAERNSREQTCKKRIVRPSWSQTNTAKSTTVTSL